MSRDWSNLLWSEMTCWERCQAAIAFIMAAIFGVGMFIGVIWVFGMMIDASAQRSMEHERCLKRATNGYEIKECR